MEGECSLKWAVATWRVDQHWAFDLLHDTTVSVQMAVILSAAIRNLISVRFVIMVTTLNGDVFESGQGPSRLALQLFGGEMG